MRARIEITAAQHAAAGSPFTQAMADAVRALIYGGGRGTHEQPADRHVHVYTFEGPPVLVRPVVASFMAYIRSTAA